MSGYSLGTNNGKTVKRPRLSDVIDPRICRIQSDVQQRKPTGFTQRPRRTYRGSNRIQKTRPVVRHPVPVRDFTRDKSAAETYQVKHQIVLPDHSTLEQLRHPDSYNYPASAAVDQYSSTLEQDTFLQGQAVSRSQSWVIGPAILPSNDYILSVLQSIDDNTTLPHHSGLEGTHCARQTTGLVPRVVSWPTFVSSALVGCEISSHSNSSASSAAFIHTGQGTLFPPEQVPAVMTDELVGLGLYDTPEQVQSASYSNTASSTLQSRSLKLEDEFSPSATVGLDAEADTGIAAWFPVADGVPYHQAQYACPPYTVPSHYDDTHLFQHNNLMRVYGRDSGTQPFLSTTPTGLHG